MNDATHTQHSYTLGIHNRSSIDIDSRGEAGRVLTQIIAGTMHVNSVSCGSGGSLREYILKTTNITTTVWAYSKCGQYMSECVCVRVCLCQQWTCD